MNGFFFLVLALKSAFEVFQLRPFLSIRGFTYVGVDQQLPFMLWGSGAWRCQLTCNNKPELFVKDDGLIVQGLLVLLCRFLLHKACAASP